MCLVAACSGELPVSNFIPTTATLAAQGYQSEIVEIDRLVFSESEIGQAGRSTDFQGDQLRLAFFDGLRERPEGFEASANQEPELVVSLKRVQ